MPERLVGKVALVTGGTSGIGAETVERFLQEGATVAFLGRNRTIGESMADRFGGQARFIPGDVAIEGDIAAAITSTAQWGGRLDILVNNAGGLAAGGVDTFTAEDLAYAMSLILGSVLYGIKHASVVMKAQGWGAIINSSSVAALRTHMGSYLYSVAKAGVSHATRLAGMELGRHGITVNCISPGTVATPLFLGGSRTVAHMRSDKVDVMRTRLLANLGRSNPLVRPGLPSDVAAAMVFLASDEGHFVNCHDLVVDGGLTAGGKNNFDGSDRFEPFR